MPIPRPCGSIRKRDDAEWTSDAGVGGGKKWLKANTIRARPAMNAAAAPPKSAKSPERSTPFAAITMPLKKNAHKNDGEHLKWNRRTAIAAIFYAGLTGLLLGAAGFSIYQTWNAIGEATRAADAATRQADISDDTEKRQLRAYMGVNPGEVTNFGTRTQIFSLTRRNVGQTPAYDVGFIGIDGDILLFGSPIPPSPGCTTPKLSDLFTIFPNNPVPWDITVWNQDKFTKDKIDTVRVNESRIGGYMFMLWGTICYRDAFKKPHYTNFCYMYHGSNIGKAPFDVCLGHNDSD
jgi:hypothetical protein